MGITLQVFVIVADSGCRLTGGRNAEGSPDRGEFDEDDLAGKVVQSNRRVRRKNLARIIRVWMPCDKGEIADDVPDLISCRRQVRQ